MSVYVDDMEAPYGRLKMCHMIADSPEELLAMADRIGVQRKWRRDAGTPREHFDICKAKRAKAIQYGAIEITQRELGRMTLARRRAEAARIREDLEWWPAPDVRCASPDSPA